MRKRWSFERQNISFWESKGKLLIGKRRSLVFYTLVKKDYIAYYQEVIKFVILRVICGKKLFCCKYCTYEWGFQVVLLMFFPCLVAIANSL